MWNEFKLTNPDVVERLVQQPPTKDKIWTEVVVPFEKESSFKSAAATPIVVSDSIE